MSELFKMKRGRALREFVKAERWLVESLQVHVYYTMVERRHLDLKKKWDVIEEMHDSYVSQLLVEDENTKVEEENG